MSDVAPSPRHNTTNNNTAGAAGMELEPIRVFIRIRPEDKGLTHLSLNSSSGGSLNNLGIASIDPAEKKSSRRSSTGGLPHTNSAEQLNVTCIQPIDNYKGVSMFKTDSGFTRSTNYKFHHVYPEDVTQEEVYNSISDLIPASIQGFNCAVFAYGVSGSGKTHSLTGSKSAPGIIPRAVHDLFQLKEKLEAEGGR